ncbi:uncharacterized protein AAGF69_012518 [Amazona ochrocephala]
MQKNVRESLVPLVLHMSDETESVAKASQEALYVAAKVLKWKWLSHHPQAHEIWRTAECLLEHDRSRAEKYARQSMAYLQHAQVSVRVAAVRFIGLAARYLKDSSKDTLQEISDALHRLGGGEEEPEVLSLVYQSIYILISIQTRTRQRRTL